MGIDSRGAWHESRRERAHRAGPLFAEVPPFADKPRVVNVLRTAFAKEKVGLLIDLLETETPTDPTEARAIEHGLRAVCASMAGGSLEADLNPMESWKLEHRLSANLLGNMVQEDSAQREHVLRVAKGLLGRLDDVDGLPHGADVAHEIAEATIELCAIFSVGAIAGGIIAIPLGESVLHGAITGGTTGAAGYAAQKQISSIQVRPREYGHALAKSQKRAIASAEEFCDLVEQQQEELDEATWKQARKHIEHHRKVINDSTLEGGLWSSGSNWEGRDRFVEAISSLDRETNKIIRHVFGPPRPYSKEFGGPDMGLDGHQPVAFDWGTLAAEYRKVIDSAHRASPADELYLSPAANPARKVAEKIQRSYENQDHRKTIFGK